MSWVSDLPSRRLCALGGRRIHASIKAAGARIRMPETAPAIPHTRGGVVPPAGRTWRMLVPALAPHPTRREASSGVIFFSAVLRRTSLRGRPEEPERREVKSTRITVDPRVVAGKPCVRGLRVTVSTIAGLLAGGHSEAEVLELHPCLAAEDIRAVEQWAAGHRGKGRRAAVRGSRGHG